MIFTTGSHTDIYILCTYIISTVLVVVVVVIILVVCLYTKRWDTTLKNLSTSNKRNKQLQAKVFGVALVSLVINLYALALDICAVHFHVNKRIEVDPTNLIQLPYWTLVFDLLAILICTTFWLLSLFCSQQCTQCCSLLNNKEYIFLALSTSGPILSVVIHLPYIAIAYLNDAYHASSIFIYYTIVTFVLFSALEVNYNACRGILIASSDYELKIHEWTLRLRSDGSEMTVYKARINHAHTNCERTVNLKVKFATVEPQNLKLRSIGIPLSHPITEQEHNFFENVARTKQVEIESPTSIQLTDRNYTKLNLKVEAEVNIVSNIDNNSESGVTTINFVEDSNLSIKGYVEKQTLHCCAKCSKSEYVTKLSFIVTIPGIALLLLALIGIVTGVIVVIPINKSISDAPNRLLGFYQSAFVLVGAFLVYWNFFKKKPSIESAVRKRKEYIPSKVSKVDSDEKWQQLSREEKVAEFYAHVVDIIANHDHQNDKANPEPEPEPEPETEPEPEPEPEPETDPEPEPEPEPNLNRD